MLNTHINVRICDKNRYLCTESVNLAIYYYMQETIKTIKLSQIKVNAENPRTIRDDKFQKLVNSILVFPKMMKIRPIVVDKEYIVLGGNMRTNALNYISKLIFISTIYTIKTIGKI